MAGPASWPEYGRHLRGRAKRSRARGPGIRGARGSRKCALEPAVRRAPRNAAGLLGCVRGAWGSLRKTKCVYALSFLLRRGSWKQTPLTPGSFPTTAGWKSSPRHVMNLERHRERDYPICRTTLRPMTPRPLVPRGRGPGRGRRLGRSGVRAASSRFGTPEGVKHPKGCSARALAWAITQVNLVNHPANSRHRAICLRKLCRLDRRARARLRVSEQFRDA
jgi:hypothetical protein